MATEAEGFIKHLAEARKTNPALNEADEVKVKVTVKAVVALCRSFYAAGHQNGRQSTDILGDFFSGRRR